MKKYLSVIISLVPSGILRVFLYRNILGYDMDYKTSVGMFNLLLFGKCTMRGARIGHFNLIDANELSMDTRSRIGRMNRFRRLNKIHLGRDSVISKNNCFFGTRDGDSPFEEYQNLITGERCIVTANHIFDMADGVTLGNNVTFAGSGSQVWTHGFDNEHVMVQAPVSLGDDVFVGSRSIILKGARITNSVSIGAGTVVSKSITEPGFYVSSCLVRKGEEMKYAGHPGLVVHGGSKFVRE